MRESYAARVSSRPPARAPSSIGAHVGWALGLGVFFAAFGALAETLVDGAWPFVLGVYGAILGPWATYLVIRTAVAHGLGHRLRDVSEDVQELGDQVLRLRLEVSRANAPARADAAEEPHA